MVVPIARLIHIGLEAAFERHGRDKTMMEGGLPFPYKEQTENFGHRCRLFIPIPQNNASVPLFLQGYVGRWYNGRSSERARTAAESALREFVRTYRRQFALPAATPAPGEGVIVPLPAPGAHALAPLQRVLHGPVGGALDALYPPGTPLPPRGRSSLYHEVLEGTTLVVTGVSVRILPGRNDLTVENLRLREIVGSPPSQIVTLQGGDRLFSAELETRERENAQPQEFWCRVTIFSRLPILEPNNETRWLSSGGSIEEAQTEAIAKVRAAYAVAAVSLQVDTQVNGDADWLELVRWIADSPDWQRRLGVVIAVALLMVAMKHYEVTLMKLLPQ